MGLIGQNCSTVPLDRLLLSFLGRKYSWSFLYAPASHPQHNPSQQCTNSTKNPSNPPFFPHPNPFRQNIFLQKSQSPVVCPHCNRKFRLLFLYFQKTTRIRYLYPPSLGFQGVDAVGRSDESESYR